MTSNVSLIEMMYIGRLLGTNIRPFLGLAGIGDLIATASSIHSRNFTVGKRLAEGETMQQVEATMDETAEGINTVRIIKNLVETYNMRAPITETIYKVVEDQITVEEGLKFLMKAPFSVDVDVL